MGTGVHKILLYYLWYQPHAEKHSSKSSVSCIQSVDWPEIICHWVFVCVLTGAVRGQSDASAEVHQSLEESSSAATVHPAGFHEDAREGWTSAHIQTERRLDRTLPVHTHTHTHTHTHSFKVDVFIFSYNLDGKSEEVSREKTRPVFFHKHHLWFCFVSEGISSSLPTLTVGSATGGERWPRNWRLCTLRRCVRRWGGMGKGNKCDNL